MSALPASLSEIIRGNYLFLGALTLGYWLVLSYYQSETRKLKHLPTAGPTWPILSYAGFVKLILNARKLVDESVKRWPTSMFKLAEAVDWLVVVSDPALVEDIYRAPDSSLSMRAAVEEQLQISYTLGENISQNPYHIPIIRSQLTKALPRFIPEVYDEVSTAFNELIPLAEGEDWKAVPLLDTVMQVVCRASNRIFVGLPLCRDPDFVKLNVQFTMEVVKAGAILKMVTPKLRPFVNPLVSNVPGSIRKGVKHLAPVIQAHREALEKDSERARNSADILTWLIEAKGEEPTDWNLTSRILTVNFAAIHTSSMSFAHAIYYLAAMPECLPVLRDEIEEVVKREGWSKAGLDQMHKLDSFIKESQRLNPLGSLMLRRLVAKDYTFSNGTTLPRGTAVAVSVLHMHLNEKSFEDPLKFDPWRFDKMRQQDVTGTKSFGLVTTGVDFLAFGHGRHACPGRYFAACELKLMMAHVALKYDLRTEPAGVRPEDMWVMSACVPNPTAKILFGKRM